MNEFASVRVQLQFMKILFKVFFANFRSVQAKINALFKLPDFEVFWFLLLELCCVRVTIVHVTILQDMVKRH